MRAVCGAAPGVGSLDAKRGLMPGPSSPLCGGQIDEFHTASFGFTPRRRLRRAHDLAVKVLCLRVEQCHRRGGRCWLAASIRNARTSPIQATSRKTVSGKAEVREAVRIAISPPADLAIRGYQRHAHNDSRGLFRTGHLWYHLWSRPLAHATLSGFLSDHGELDSYAVPAEY